MRAWLLDHLSGIGSLRLAEVPDPIPQAGEVILRVHYAALNPADRYLAEGQYPAKPSLPHILGRDGMGTIEQLGPGVNQLQLGDRRAILRGEVGVTRPGTFAERVAVPVEYLVDIPAGWSEPEAGGAALAYLTGYQALTMWGALPPDGLVLITGASGGVGVAVVQLAQAMGQRVIALSRSEEKRHRLRELGATDTFDPGNPDWSRSAKAAIGPHRVGLAIDNIGGKLLPEVIELLGDLGRVSVVGRLAGPVPEFNTATLFFRRIRLGGVAVGAWTSAESRAAWGEVLRLLVGTNVRPLVDSVFPLPDLPKAFERLAKGPMGKVVIANGAIV
jgi:NADPH2:quinone reductase